MTDGEALYRAILCDPHDDTVRLAYADWLEGVGQELRARIIRLGIEHEHRERTIIVRYYLRRIGRTHGAIVSMQHFRLDGDAKIKPRGTTALLREEIQPLMRYCNLRYKNRFIYRRGLVESVIVSEEQAADNTVLATLFSHFPITQVFVTGPTRPSGGQAASSRVTHGRTLAGLPPLGS